MLPILPTQVLDLTQMSQEGLNSRMEVLFNQVIPQWSDFSLSHPENVLKENMALIMAMAVETMNERFRQISMATVTDRLAIIRQGRPNGYELTEATAAEFSGRIKLPNGALATKQVLLPIGKRWSSPDGDEFASTASTTINVGQNASSVITFKNWEEQIDSFISDEVANIVLKLSQKNYIQDTLVISAADGTYLDVDGDGKKWRSFLEMGPSTLGFMAFADDNGYVYTFFGDSITGTIPRGTITCTYKHGGGEIGRIEIGTVWKGLDAIYDIDGSPVTVELENTTASTGGTDATTVEEARIRLPLAIRTRERSVNEADCERAAVSVSGIATAALLTSNHDTSIEEDRARLYLVAYGTPYSDAEGGGYYPPAEPTTDQIAAVEALLEENGAYEALMGGVITVLAATFFDITVSVKIRKASNFSATAVKDSISKELKKFFAVADEKRALREKIDFGYRLLDNDGDPDYLLAWSDIFNAIRDAEGVREITYDSSNLLLNAMHQSVTLQPREFPRLTTIAVYDMDNGGVEI